jgi:hypothetical protein
VASHDVLITAGDETVFVDAKLNEHRDIALFLLSESPDTDRQPFLRLTFRDGLGHRSFRDFGLASLSAASRASSAELTGCPST